MVLTDSIMPRRSTDVLPDDTFRGQCSSDASLIPLFLVLAQAALIRKTSMMTCINYLRNMLTLRNIHTLLPVSAFASLPRN